MQYRNFGRTGLLVSALGFGTMRFPTKTDGDGNTVVQAEEAIRMMREGIDGGINYIDTAYPYHEGESERIVGRALLDGYRERVILATKCPIWAVEKTEDFERILAEQLEKLQTEVIDCYLLHALNKERWEKVLKLGLLEEAEKARAAGKIRFLGFSFHDDAETFETILNGHDRWDFCQIQMNYIDVDHQATLKGLREAGRRGLGVVIMEPLLGGKLACPPENVRKILNEGGERSPVEWAMDFLWDMPEVSLLLSGMSDLKQTRENLAFAEKAQVGMLSEAERNMLGRAKTVYETMALVACTKCRYCMPCPFGLSIPDIFEVYNQSAVKGIKEAAAAYEKFKVRADACRACRHCEGECPQQLPISGLMREIHEKLDGMGNKS